MAVRLLGYLVSAGFLALGILTVRDYLRQRDRRRGLIALAIGLIAVTNLIGQFNTLTGQRFTAVTTPVSITVFMASACALLLFRGTFIPLARATRAAALLASAAAVLAALVIGLPHSGAPATGSQSLAVIAIILVWSVIVSEPIVRFWLASNGRPSVQKARLRVLAGGFAGILVILLVAGFAGRAATSLALQLVFQVVALLTIPLLYASFAPPRWLRRFWRESEEDALRRSNRDLVLFSPDRATLANRSLDAGLRLVGADAGAIIDADQVLAMRGMDEATARRLADGAKTASHTDRIFPLPDPHRNALVIPLGLQQERGTIVMISGAFMPLFGSDEVLRFEQFSANLALALDRVRVVERMAEVERTKSHFLNLASHELRTPLSVIRGYLSILESGSLGTLNSSGRHAVSILSAKALEMNLLIEQMLEAARLEEGRLALRVERLDLGKVACEAIEMVRPLADDAHPLVLEEAEDQVMVMADRDRLTTILTNLIDNGIKYSPTGGAVTCVIALRGQEAVVSVRDHGVGIAEADLPKLFTRFGRVLTDDTRHIKGTGLGLYLSRELARQMGGEVAVASVRGSGSTFTLTMPVAAQEAAQPPRPPTGLRVLESTGTSQP